MRDQKSVFEYRIDRECTELRSSPKTIFVCVRARARYATFVFKITTGKTETECQQNNVVIFRSYTVQKYKLLHKYIHIFV